MANYFSKNTVMGELPIQDPSSKQSSKYPHTEQISGQTQMRRDDYENQTYSDISSHDQGSSFLQETGTQAKSMAQGAVNLAKEAASGAANMAQGAAGALKTTLGINASDPNSTTSMNLPRTSRVIGNTTPNTGSTTSSVPSTTVDLGDPIYPSTPK